MFPEHNALYFKEADEKVACDQVIHNVVSENKYTTNESKMQICFCQFLIWGYLLFLLIVIFYLYICT